MRERKNGNNRSLRAPPTDAKTASNDHKHTDKKPRESPPTHCLQSIKKTKFAASVFHFHIIYLPLQRFSGYESIGNKAFMKKNLFVKILLAATLQLFAIATRAQITGQVVDSEDGYPVPYATVGYEGMRLSVQSDDEGRFSIERHVGQTIVARSVGYVAEKVKVRENTNNLTIKLKQETTKMDEVEVRGRRKRYSRKENPAVELMRRVIEAKKLTDLENYPYYQYMKYQKITLARNDVDTTGMTKEKWYSENLERSDYNGKLVLPLTMSETVTHHLYSKDPQKTRDIIIGQHSEGLNKLLQTGEIVNTMLKEVFTDVNLYDDHIRLVQYPFPSPIGRTAISFYHFYIQDTVKVAGDSCFHLRFYPANQQDFGFTGDLYILKDSTLHVKQCVLNIPEKSDVNWVKSMRIEQQYTQLENGEWVLTHDDMWAELSISGLLPKALVTRTTRLNSYKFDDIPRSLLRGKARTIEEANARIRDDAFWDKERPVELTKSERNIDNLVDRIRQSKGFGVIMVGVKAFAENFIETSGEGKKSKVDIGPVNTVISNNFVDGYRFRASARTMAALNPHVFLKGYGAYGTRSNRWYYGSELTYSINEKQNSPFEFPMRNLVFTSERDVMSPADKFLINNKDNVFMSIRTQDIRQMYFYDRQQLSFVYETDWGFSINASIKAESNEVAGDLHFLPVNGGPEVRKIRTTELSGGIRFCPGQTFINTKQHRWPVNLDHPDISLTHTVGMDRLLGGQYKLNYTELQVYKRQWLGSWGYIDMHANGAIQWNKVPFPLLIMPPTNFTYLDNEVTFGLMNNMEFLTDRQLFMSVSWDMNGKLLNRLPLIKKLKWREYFSVKAMWGDLTDKNNPILHPEDPMLFRLPEGSYIINSTPYWEVEAGVHNIFNVFGVTYVRRMSYRQHENTDKWGIRFLFNLTF